MRKKRKYSVYLLISCLITIGIIIGLSAAVQQTDPLTLWTMTKTNRILRNETPSFDPATTVALTSAKNEWEDFQILLRSTGDVTINTISAGNLSHEGGTGTISSDNIEIYRMHQTEVKNRSGIMFGYPTPRPEYPVNEWYPDALIPMYHPVTHAPLPVVTPVPGSTDPLYRAVPFTIPADQTHGYLVDIYVPTDALAGGYTGTITINYGDNLTKDITVTLQVRNFALPEVPELETMFHTTYRGFDNAYYLMHYNYYKQLPWKWGEVMNQNCKMLQDHGIAQSIPGYHVKIKYDKTTGSFTDTDGLAFSTIKEFIKTYPGSTMEVPFGHISAPFFKLDENGNIVNDLPPSLHYVMWEETGIANVKNNFHDEQISLLPTPENALYFNDAEKNRLITYLNCWDDMIDRLKTDPEVGERAKNIEYYIYLHDEPWSFREYCFVKKVGAAIKENSSNINNIKVMITDGPNFRTGQAVKDANDTIVYHFPSLIGSVDIWGPNFQRSYIDPFAEDSIDTRKIKAAKARGEKIWFYPAGDGWTPMPYWFLDYPVLHYRIPVWYLWAHDFDGLLLWTMSYYTKRVWPAQNDPTAVDQVVYDLWHDPSFKWTPDMTYPNSNVMCPPANMGGALIYPAWTAGYMGIAPSLRFKALRDSIEDYAYFKYLERYGLKDEIRDKMLGINPTGTPDPKLFANMQFGNKAGLYEDARDYLGDRIDELVTASSLILLVDDDGVSDTDDPYNFIQEYQHLLDLSNREYIVWDTASEGAPELDSLSKFDIVVWFTGRNDTPITPDDQLNLMKYLNAGGRLCLSGRFIASHIGLTDFHRNYLRSWYIDQTTRECTLFRGPNLTLLPSTPLVLRELMPGEPSRQVITKHAEPSVSIYNYAIEDTNKTGGLTWDNGVYKVVYFPFGLEDITNTDAVKQELMSAMFNWLEAAD